MSNHLIKVLPFKKAFFCGEEQAVLDAALAAGLPMPHSCRSGNCGRCMAHLISGEAIYRDNKTPLGITLEQRQQQQVLLCQLQPRGALTIEAHVEQDAKLNYKVVKLPARIQSKQLLAADVMRIDVQLPRSQPLQFKPGQYVDFILPGNLKRSYSIASLPSPKEPLEFHIRRFEGGLFSNWIFADADERHLTTIRGPYGDYGWRDIVRPVLLVAGGTGYAPILAMLREWLEMPQALHQSQPVHFFWGARDQQDLYDSQWLQELCATQTGFKFTGVVENFAGVVDSHVDDSMEGLSLETGWVHKSVLTHYADLSGFDVYASGPPPMITAIEQEFVAAGVKRLFTDSFDPA